MTERMSVAIALLMLLGVLPAMLGLLAERVWAHRPRAETLLSADKATARARLVYFNEVHDSHSG